MVGGDEKAVVGPDAVDQLAEPGIDVAQHPAVALDVLLVAGEVGLLDVRHDQPVVHRV